MMATVRNIPKRDVADCCFVGLSRPTGTPCRGEAGVVERGGDGRMRGDDDMSRYDGM